MAQRKESCGWWKWGGLVLLLAVGLTWLRLGIVNGGLVQGEKTSKGSDRRDSQRVNGDSQDRQVTTAKDHKLPVAGTSQTGDQTSVIVVTPVVEQSQADELTPAPTPTPTLVVQPQPSQGGFIGGVQRIIWNFSQPWTNQQTVQQSIVQPTIQQSTTQPTESTARRTVKPSATPTPVPAAELTPTFNAEEVRRQALSIKEKVSNLEKVETRKPGLVNEITSIVNSNQYFQDQLDIEIDQIEARQGLTKNILGPNYTALKKLNELSVSNQAVIKKLQDLLASVNSASDQLLITDTVDSIKRANAAIEQQIANEEQTPSIFGFVMKKLAGD